jgi:hypothetical protein
MSEIRIRHDVVFAGENPLLMLYRPGSDEVIAVASYWQCSYSTAGAGEALVIWVDPERSGLGDRAPVGIYTNNAPMARLVWDTFNRHFDRLQGHGIEDHPLQPARFTQQADGMRLHRVVCSIGTTTIELEWRDAIEALHTVTTPEVGGSRWEVTNVICPCPDAGIRVDGVEVIGEVREPEGWFRSSAFLAFVESWVRLE